MSPDHDCGWRKLAEDREQQLDAAKAQLAEYERELHALKKQVFGRTSEKRPHSQVGKGGRSANDAAAQEKRRAHRDKRAEAPVEQVEHRVPDERRGNCPTCGEAELQPMPADLSSEYEYVPGYFLRREHLRETLRCPNCHHFERGPAPVRIWDKAQYGPGFCAQTIVQKCDDCLPLYRQAKGLSRDGVPIARSTLVDLFHRCAELITPIYNAMLALLPQHHVVYADETSLKMQRKEKLGFIWTFACQMLIVYWFSPDRSGDTPRRVLGNSPGLLVVDGYTGYNGVTTPQGRIRAGCNSHGRRKFIDLDNKLAKQVVELYDEVFAVERDAKQQKIQGTAQHLRLRQSRSRPTMEKIRKLCETGRGRHPPKHPLGQAAGYILNQWEFLTRFLDHVEIDPHNNLSERLLRVIALGRKNYLFVGHEEAGQNLAMLCSLIATCKLHDVNPQQYLADVLIRIQEHPSSAVQDLLPHRWKGLFLQE